MDSDLVPPAQREAVARALVAVFATAEPDELTPVAGGFSSARVFRVAAGGRRALLRLESVRDALRDPARQHACMRIAADAGVAPALRYADPEGGVAILDFVDQVPRDRHPGGAQGIALDAGRLLGRLQRGPLFPSLVDWIDGVDAAIAHLLASGGVEEAAVAEPLAAYRRIRDAYPRARALVSSHNDPNPNNVLYDGTRVWLVDWEAAFAADPHVDPAHLANWFGLEGDAEVELLRAVFDDVDEVRLARHALMRPICRTFYAVVMLGLDATRDRPVADLDGPELEEIRAGLRTGAVSFARVEDRRAFGKASLRAVQDAARGPIVAEAARVLA